MISQLYTTVTLSDFNDSKYIEELIYFNIGIELSNNIFIMYKPIKLKKYPRNVITWYINSSIPVDDNYVKYINKLELNIEIYYVFIYHVINYVNVTKNIRDVSKDHLRECWRSTQTKLKADLKLYNDNLLHKMQYYFKLKWTLLEKLSKSIKAATTYMRKYIIPHIISIKNDENQSFLKNTHMRMLCSDPEKLHTPTIKNQCFDNKLVLSAQKLKLLIDLFLIDLKYNTYRYIEYIENKPNVLKRSIMRKYTKRYTTYTSHLIG